MWPLENADDNLEAQIKLHAEIIEEKQKEIDALPEEGQNVAMDAYRAELTDQMRNAELNRPGNIGGSLV